MTDYQFDNGYGASVIPDRWTTETAERFELAVIKKPGWSRMGPWPITYETPITDNVLTWLTHSEVQAVLTRIEALTPADVAAETIRRKRFELDKLREQSLYLEAVIAELENADELP